MVYDYKKIQEMRSMLFEEIKTRFGILNVDHHMLVEQMLQTCVMAGLFDSDIKKEVRDNRIKDK
mgnify:CR=1 FL=1|tara:strand:- start:145 stop:336 length:192 start_codon:yes stop_codon:yes gene_type:complete